jgi:hypothetical protein
MFGVEQGGIFIVLLRALLLQVLQKIPAPFSRHLHYESILSDLILTWKSLRK